MSKKRGRRTINKIASIITVICLTGFLPLPQNVYGETAIRLQDVEKTIPDPMNIRVPDKWGAIDSLSLGSKDKTIILLQDAHSIPDAQESIQKLILYFQEAYHLRLVMLEGASTPLNPHLFKNFPDPSLLEKALQAYRDRGEVTGVTGAALLSPHKSSYHGIEDWTLYEQGLEHYFNALDRKADVMEILRIWREKLEQAKGRIYSAELLQTDRAEEKFRGQEIDMVSALQELSPFLSPEKGSGLELVLARIKQNGKLPPEQASLIQMAAERLKTRLFSADETEPLGRERQSEWNERTQAYQTSRIGPVAYAVFLTDFAERFDVEIPGLDSLRPLIENDERLSQLHGRQLMKEFESCLAELRERLFRNDAERRLDQQSRRLRLLTQLTALELSREGWEEVKRDEKILPKVLKEKLTAHFGFYRTAELRDAAFLKRLEVLMNDFDTDLGLFVTGGFHVSALASGLEQLGYSTIVVTPRMQSLPEDNPYSRQMHGDVSWKEFLNVQNGDIDLSEAFSLGFGSALLSQSEDKNNLIRQWEENMHVSTPGETKGRSQDFVILRKLSGMALRRDLESQWQSNIDRFLNSLAHLKSSGNLTEEKMLDLLNASTMAAATLAAQLASDHSRVLAGRLDLTRHAGSANDLWNPDHLDGSTPVSYRESRIARAESRERGSEYYWHRYPMNVSEDDAYYYFDVGETRYRIGRHALEEAQTLEIPYPFEEEVLQGMYAPIDDEHYLHFLKPLFSDFLKPLFRTLRKILDEAKRENPDTLPTFRIRFHKDRSRITLLDCFNNKLEIDLTETWEDQASEETGLPISIRFHPENFPVPQDDSDDLKKIERHMHRYAILYALIPLVLNPVTREDALSTYQSFKSTGDFEILRAFLTSPELEPFLNPRPELRQALKDTTQWLAPIALARRFRKTLSPAGSFARHFVALSAESPLPPLRTWMSGLVPRLLTTGLLLGEEGAASHLPSVRSGQRVSDFSTELNYAFERLRQKFGDQKVTLAFDLPSADTKRIAQLFGEGTFLGNYVDSILFPNPGIRVPSLLTHKLQSLGILRLSSIPSEKVIDYLGNAQNRMPFITFDEGALRLYKVPKVTFILSQENLSSLTPAEQASLIDWITFLALLAAHEDTEISAALLREEYGFSQDFLPEGSVWANQDCVYFDFRQMLAERTLATMA